jgi:hypothetical protein
VSDNDYIRYMLDGGTRGMITNLVETRDAWGFGGSLWISKTSAHYRAGETGTRSTGIFALQTGSAFEKTWFEIDTGAKGWALWFRAPGMKLDGRMLCGWVPPEREAAMTGWISLLNDEITKRVNEAENANPVSSERSFEMTKAFFEHLGIAVPAASNTDAFVTAVESAAKADGPLDRRSKASSTPSEASAWLNIGFGSGLWGYHRFRINAAGRIAFEYVRRDFTRHVTAQLTDVGLQRLHTCVDVAFANPPAPRMMVPDSMVLDVVVESSGKKLVVGENHGLADPNAADLVKLVAELAKLLGHVPRAASTLVEVLDETESAEVR